MAARLFFFAGKDKVEHAGDSCRADYSGEHPAGDGAFVCGQGVCGCCERAAAAAQDHGRCRRHGGENAGEFHIVASQDSFDNPSGKHRVV